MSDDRALLHALGRLDPAKELEFLRAAKVTITRFNAARDARKAPTLEDYEALEGVRRDAENLWESLARASRLGLPAEYLHEAWRNCQPGPEYAEYPDFDQLLWQLAQSAMWFMKVKEKRPAHRPDEIWSHTAIIVRFLVLEFHQLFGEPTLGSNSPFVKFCRKFLPANGLKCPSLATLTKIRGKTKSQNR